MEKEIKILIVEDDVITTMYWVTTLRKLNYTSVRTATTGKEAIELSKSENPDIVIMDVHLIGKLDGIETAKAINSFCEAYFIFTTGDTNNDIIKKIATIKSADCLVKPITINDVHILIKKRVSLT